VRSAQGDVEDDGLHPIDEQVVLAAGHGDSSR
jgi:hypothetical protein